MKNASIVFIPGHSGLSVNHAFAYGRPYVTLQGPSHAPELGYLTHGKDGFLLDDDINTNINKIAELLKNKEVLNQFCENARQRGKELSVEKWVEQMKHGLIK